MEKMENLSGIKYKDSDDKTSKGHHHNQQFSIDLGSINGEFAHQNIHCSGFSSNDIFGVKPSNRTSLDDDIKMLKQDDPHKQEIKFPDISAIESNSDNSFILNSKKYQLSAQNSEEKKIQSLTRNMMPVIIVHVGDRQV